MLEAAYVRIAARFPPGEGGGWERIVEALSASGFRAWEKGAELGDSLIEYLGSSMEGDEVLMRVRVVGSGEALDRVAEALLPPCWYLDIYYSFRGEEALALARRLGVEHAGKTVKKMEGIDVVVEYYPKPRRLVVSYRVGWDKRWGDKPSKIHRFLYSGERRIGVWRWIR